VQKKRKKREPEDVDPVAEYNSVKEDPFGSWFFIEDDEFMTRVAILFSVGFIPIFLILCTVFPILSDAGQLQLNNLATDIFYASGIGVILVLLLCFWAGLRITEVDKILRRKSIVLEYDPSNEQTSGTMGFYTTVQQKTEVTAKRDRLIATYSVEPALSRLRSSLLVALVLAPCALAAGGASGGVVKPRRKLTPEEEEIEERRRRRDEGINEALDAVLGPGRRNMRTRQAT